ncbi:MAG: SpoIIE family protein phosphatase [Candidatus Zhuqueibacterota bacterium]
MKPLPFTFGLKLKIALSFILLVIVIMATVTYIFTIRELSLRVQQVKLRMERLANNIATIRSVEMEGWDIYQTYIDNQIILNPDIVYIAIYNEAGELKVHTLNKDWIDEDDLKNLTQLQLVQRLDQRHVAEESQQDLESKSVNIIIGDKNLGTVKVGFSLVDVNDEKWQNLRRNLILAVIFIFLSIVASYVMSNRIVTPLGRLTRAMVRISEGDLNQHLEIKSRDEIGEMAATFNFMTKGLQEKEIIEDLNTHLGFTFELKKIADLLTEKITLALNARSGFLLLRKTGTDVRAFRLASAYPRSGNSDIPIDRKPELCSFFLAQRRPLDYSELKPFPDFMAQLESLDQFSAHTLICPIIIKDEILGLFLLNENNSRQPFDSGERDFLSTLLGQGGMAIENAMLYEELTEQERIKHELEIAHKVQLGLLPRENPGIHGLDIDGVCIPAAEVGGDYYDFFKLNQHTLGIAIADVTGKGTSAAFYMAVVKGMMLSLTSMIHSPRQLLIELNRRLFGQMDRKIFITMVYAVFDTQQNLVWVSRAGHNEVIRRNIQNADVEKIVPAGIGLGLEKGELFDRTITEERIAIQSGDIFLFYTDGISDAMNAEKDQFGESRLNEIIATTTQRQSSLLRGQIIQSIQNFVQESPQHDDMTMVTVMVK